MSEEEPLPRKGVIGDIHNDGSVIMDWDGPYLIFPDVGKAAEYLRGMATKFEEAAARLKK